MSQFITKDELMRLMLEMKKQIDIELKKDLEQMEQRINKRIDTIKSNTANIISEKMENIQADRQLAVNNNQIIEMQKNTRELVKAATTQMAEKVYAKINNEIATQIMPKIDSAVEWLNYNTQDTDGILDAYRREVEYRHRSDDRKLLTDGKDKRVISEHVRTFWSDD